MPLQDIEHAISSAQSNKLIGWQTGKLFAYLTLRNSSMNVTYMPGFLHKGCKLEPILVRFLFSIVDQNLLELHDFTIFHDPVTI